MSGWRVVVIVFETLWFVTQKFAPYEPTHNTGAESRKGER